MIWTMIEKQLESGDWQKLHDRNINSYGPISSKYMVRQ